MDDNVLINGLKKLSRDIADIADALGVSEADPAPEQETVKQCSYEEVRAVLADKARMGFRAEVKALLSTHGVNQLSDVSDPAVFTEIMAEAEGIGNA